MTAFRRLRQTRSRSLRILPYRFHTMAAFAVLLAGSRALGQATVPSPITTDEDVPISLPPPERFLLYGLSLVGEAVASPGPLCNDADPCVFGSGGGLTARIGWRTAGPLYFGGAYELSVHDSSNLMRLATLQQLRGEVRYSFFPWIYTQPYVGASLGAMIFGNELQPATYGPTAGVSAGAEWELSRTLVARLSMSYRVLLFHSFTDPSLTFRNGGPAHLVGFDFTVEARDRY